jgi:hypothetical protein
VSETQARRDFAIRLDAKNAGKLREIVPRSRGAGFLENDRNILTLDSVELNGYQAINRVDGVAAGYHDSDRERHGKGRENCSPTAPIEVTDDHSGSRG